MEKIGTSDFYNHAIHIEESITLDDASTGEADDCNIVTTESSFTVDDSVVITVGEGKTIIPDLYNVFAKSPKA